MIPVSIDTTLFDQVDINLDSCADWSDLLYRTLWLDVSPRDNCGTADLSFCSGKIVTLNYRPDDPLQQLRAETLIERIQNQKPQALVINLPDQTIVKDFRTGTTKTIDMKRK